MFYDHFSARSLLAKLGRAAALRLSLDACSVKALSHYYGGRFIFVARINRVVSNGNTP